MGKNKKNKNQKSNNQKRANAGQDASSGHDHDENEFVEDTGPQQTPIEKAQQYKEMQL